MPDRDTFDPSKTRELIALARASARKPKAIDPPPQRPTPASTLLVLGRTTFLSLGVASLSIMIS